MINKSFFRAIAIASALTAMSFSTSASAASGKVSRIYISGGGVVHVLLANDPCKGYWKFKISAPAGQGWYTLLLAAYHAGTVVHLGTPPCEQNVGQYIKSVYQNF